MISKNIFYSSTLFCVLGITLYFTFSKDISEIFQLGNHADSVLPKKIPNEIKQTIKINEKSIYISENSDSKMYHVQSDKKLKDLENEFINYKSFEIQHELKKMNELLISQKLIKNSNSGNLTSKEANTLASLLRKKSMLHKILLDRKIHSLEAKL